MGLIEKVIEQTIQTRGAQNRLRPFLTKDQSYDRIQAQLREAMIRTALLTKCDPDTVIDAVVTIQRWQLEIGETAHLVPFKDTRNSRWVCTPVRGYIGDIELLIRNGIARRVDAFCVYEGEPFTYREGTSPLLEHQPLAPSQRGKMIGAYAILWQTFTNCKATFLYLEEIEAIREKYSKQWNRQTVGDCPPWYSKKCAVKAVTKLLPKSPKLAKLRELMDEDELVVTSVRKAIDAPRPAHITDDGEDLSGAEADGNGAAASQAASVVRDTEAPAPTTSDAPFCPKCSGEMWDNRLSKKNPKAPDWKCRDKSCDGVIWPSRGNTSNTQGALPIEDEPAKAPNAVSLGH